jgi:DNA-binding LytR/AlgR family response regulator
MLRVLIADDERPAREFLRWLLVAAGDVEIVGEAANGAEALELIEQLSPDLALLDLQMPVIDGLGVATRLRRGNTPLIAFVTAFDAHAVQAFEANAIDYLLKPVEPARLRRTLMCAHERLERADVREAESARVETVARDLMAPAPAQRWLQRVPVRRRDDIALIPVETIAAIIADGELLHLHALTNERHTITYRLKDLEARLDPSNFVRLSRGALVNVNAIQSISPMPGGTYLVTLRNRLQVPVSRLRARVLRHDLLSL